MLDSIKLVIQIIGSGLEHAGEWLSLAFSAIPRFTVLVSFVPAPVATMLSIMFVIAVVALVLGRIKS